MDTETQKKILEVNEILISLYKKPTRAWAELATRCNMYYTTVKKIMQGGTTRIGTATLVLDKATELIREKQGYEAWKKLRKINQTEKSSTLNNNPIEIRLENIERALQLIVEKLEKSDTVGKNGKNKNNKA